MELKTKTKKGWRQRHSIFRITFLVLIFFMIIMLFYMLWYTGQVTYRKKQQEMDANYIRMMEQSEGSMDQVMDNLEGQISLLIYEDEWIRYMFRNERTTDNDGYIILQYLASLAQNPAVDNVWFYSQKYEDVFSSSGYREKKTESEQKDVLEFHESRQAQWQWLSADRKQDIFTYGGRIYAVIDFVPAKSIGTFMMELSQEYLLKVLGGQDALENGISIYDSNGVWIFPEEKRGEAVDGRYMEEVNLYSDAEVEQSAKYQWYYAQSESMGWNYIMPLDRTTSPMSMMDIVKAMLPCILAVLLLGISGSYIITREIYAPIDHLMNLAMGEKRKKNVLFRENEVAFLERQYQKYTQETSEMRQVMQNVSQDMKEQFCQKLLLGRNMSDSYQNGVMKVTGLERMEDVRFMVLDVELTSEYEVLQAQVESNLFVMSVQGMLEKEKGHIATVILDDREMAAVFGFEDTMSVLEIKQIMNELQERLTQLVHSVSCHAVMSCGHLYPDIRDIRFSYQEAREKIRYQAYMGEEESAAGPQEELVGENDAAQTQYDAGWIGRMIQEAAGGRLEEGRKMLLRLLQEIFGEKNPGSRCMLLRDMLIEKLLSYRMDREENQIILENLHFPEPSGDSAGVWQANTVRILEQIASCAGKKQYLYMEQAKKFIAEHFAESNMTVNDVSDHIGIHVSYFSSLFNEIMNESFSSYLNRIRVDHAKDMLKMTKISVKDVGFKCGFNTVQTFGRVFKKYTMMSPGQYRDSVRSGSTEETK